MGARAPRLVMLAGMQCSPQSLNPVADALRARIGELHLTAVPVGTEPGGLDALVERILPAHREPVVLFGHSLGGTVAWSCARRHPERVAGIVTVCANPRPPRADQLTAWRDLQTHADRPWSAAQVDALVAKLVGDGDGRIPAARERVAEQCAQMIRETTPAQLHAQLDLQVTRVDERPALARYGGPVLAVGADDDRLVGLDAVEEAAVGVRARCVALSGVSHMAPLTAPDAVADVVADWLRSDVLAERSPSLERHASRG